MLQYVGEMTPTFFSCFIVDWNSNQLPAARPGGENQRISDKYAPEVKTHEYAPGAGRIMHRIS